MRLIISYTVGDGCTYSNTIIEPIIYSSKEEAILDFGSKIAEIMDLKKSYKEKYDKWDRHIRSISLANVEKRMKVMQERPEEPSYSFEFGGRTFEFHSFVDYDYNEGTESINEPDIFTVDEWFKCVESVK